VIAVITAIIIEIKNVLQSSADVPLIARLQSTDLKVIKLDIYVGWADVLHVSAKLLIAFLFKYICVHDQVLCSDSIVVWRAWAVWNGDNPLVNISLASTMLANIGKISLIRIL